MNADHRSASTRIRVRVTPRSRGDAIVGWSEGPGDLVLRVRVSAPPVEGKANAALVRLLSKALRVPRRDVAVVRGETCRDKLVEVSGLTASEVEGRLGCQESRVSSLHPPRPAPESPARRPISRRRSSA